MPLYFSKDYALMRMQRPDMISTSLMAMALHWFLVYNFAKGFFYDYVVAFKELHGYYPVVKIIFISVLLCLATVAYWKAALLDPGHIDYDKQFRLSVDKLNLRLLKFLYSQENKMQCQSPKRGSIVTPLEKCGDFPIEFEHTETELVEQESFATER